MGKKEFLKSLLSEREAHKNGKIPGILERGDGNPEPGKIP
jgi:hypothetical protein